MDGALAPVEEIRLDVDPPLGLTHLAVAIRALHVRQRAHDGEAETLEAVPVERIDVERHSAEGKTLVHGSPPASGADRFARRFPCLGKRPTEKLLATTAADRCPAAEDVVGVVRVQARPDETPAGPNRPLGILEPDLLLRPRDGQS